MCTYKVPDELHVLILHVARNNGFVIKARVFSLGASVKLDCHFVFCIGRHLEFDRSVHVKQIEGRHEGQVLQRAACRRSKRRSGRSILKGARTLSGPK